MRVTAHDPQPATEGGHAVGQSLQTWPAGIRTTRAFVSHCDPELAVLCGHPDLDPVHVRVLDGVGHAFGDDELRSGLDAFVEAGVDDGHVELVRDAAGQVLHRRTQTARGERLRL